MNSLYKPLIFALLLLAVLHPARSQSFSNAGKEFWVPFAYHFIMKNNPSKKADMIVYLTSDKNTNYKIEIYGGVVLRTGSVRAGDTVVCAVPYNYALVDEGRFSGMAVHIVSDDPVTVYSYLSRDAQSAATLCLPVQVLGKEYYSMNFRQISNNQYSHSFFTIIAIEDGATSVEITPAANTVKGLVAGKPDTIILQKGQIYQVLGYENASPNSNGFYEGGDLTGSKIVSIASGTSSCKRIAVFSGAGKVTIGDNCTGSSDNLLQQLYPINTWGKSFLAVPSYKRLWNFYRIIAKNPNTNLLINNLPSPMSSKGSVLFKDFYTDKPVKIESLQGDICVAQYFTTADCPPQNPNPYDPDMIILNPVEQNIKNVTLINAKLYNPGVQQHSIHVIMRTEDLLKSKLNYDGVDVPDNLWKLHPGDNNYSYLYVNDFKTVTEGFHTLASDYGFNALAYGYANFESYGYSAGANVRDKYQYLSIENDSATVQIPQACSGRPFTFELTVPYEIIKMDWSFANITLPVGSDPVPELVRTETIDGKVLNTYKLSIPYVVNIPGKYILKLKMDINNIEGCSGTEETEFEFEVKNRPSADAKKQKNCVSDPIEFSDNSQGNGSFLSKFYWDFDDNNYSNEMDPVHKFNAPKKYEVKHWVVNDIGCLSDTVKYAINIDSLPEPGFRFTNATCEERLLPILDTSILHSSDANYKFLWKIESLNEARSGKNPVFVLGAGTYNLKQIVTNANLCTDSITRSITVYQVPKTNFIPPEACLRDDYAKFTNATPLISGTYFNYEWDFDDGGKSNDENPIHKYTAIKSYNAKLKITSDDGKCDSTKAITFQINGVNPKAAITTLSNCSNKEFIIQNNSYVLDGGNVVKVNVIWDTTVVPTPPDTIDQNPLAGSQYKHQYPLVTFPDNSRNYPVRFIAYSGETCLDVLDTTIQVLAAPVTKLNPIPSICQEKSDTLIKAIETSGLPGDGVFTIGSITLPSFDSVTAEFNPGRFGPSQHTVLFTYTGDNGCTDMVSRKLVVNPTPSNVSAGGDASGRVYTLEEDSLQLKGSATGLGLTYLWEPFVAMNDNHLKDPKVSPFNDITYKLTATSDSGCKASAYVNVVVLKKLIIPSAFTPTGAINRFWNVTPLSIYPGATVRIFTRYGQLVYESVGYSTPWDGTYNGNPLPAGTYYWVIDPKKRKPLSGSVTIIR